MTIAEMTEAATALILRRNHLSFVELCRHGPGLGGGTRDYCFVPEPNLVIVLWTGLTEDGCEVIRALGADPRIEMNPTSPLTYYIDGQALRLPLFKMSMVKTRNREREKVVWQPVVFSQAKAQQRAKAAAWRHEADPDLSRAEADDARLEALWEATEVAHAEVEADPR